MGFGGRGILFLQLSTELGDYLSSNIRATMCPPQKINENSVEIYASKNWCYCVKHYDKL